MRVELDAERARRAGCGSSSALGQAHRGRRGLGGQDHDAQRDHCAAQRAHPGAVHFARGNLNNLIGVPLVLLGLEPEHSVGVVEIGTNAPGEVRALSTMAAPDLAVLTLIGVEHSEGLGDLDGIEREEGEIWSGLGPRGHGRRATPTTLRVQRTLQAHRHTRSLSYGYAEGANYRLRSRTPSALGGSRLEVERRTLVRARCDRARNARCSVRRARMPRWRRWPSASG